MPGYDAINTFLCGKIKEQNVAINTVSEKLQQLISGKVVHHGSSNICKLVFSGPSGCGKTESVRWLKYLLGMDSGYEHESQYIELENDNEPLLIRMLNEALEWHEDGSTTSSTYPRYILLSINDVSPTFIASITTLLNTGRYHSFRLPQETKLLIVFTCNYGETQIREMKYRVEHEALYFIQSEMQQNGLSESQITQMGRIIPFYALKTDVLRDILMERLENFINTSDISRQFGEIKYDGDVKKMLIDKVINLAAPGCGIRNGLGELFDKVDGFFDKALRELNRREHELQARHKENEPPNSGLMISLREIDAKEIESRLEEECDSFIQEIIQSLLRDPQSLEMIHYHREKRENINALSMHFNMQHLITSDLCGSVIYAHQQNNLFNHCQFGVAPEKYQRLKQENKDLRKAIEKVNTLVSHQRSNPPLVAEIKEIIIESAKHLHSSDEDDEIRVEELLQYECGTPLALCHSLTLSTSSTSDEEEEEDEGPRESKNDRMIRLYGDLDPDDLSDISLPSEIDESSGEEDRREVERIKNQNKRQKEKLVKRMKHTQLRCQGPCGLIKDVKAFNPQLRKCRNGPKLTFRKECNRCRKR